MFASTISSLLWVESPSSLVPIFSLTLVTAICELLSIAFKSSCPKCKPLAKSINSI